MSIHLLFGFIYSLSSNTDLARSSPVLKQRFSSILKETAAARLDAESLSNGSPTQVKSTSDSRFHIWVVNQRRMGKCGSWVKDRKEHKEHMYHKEHKEHMDHKGLKRLKGLKDRKEHKGLKEHMDHKGLKEHRELKEN
ncbi:hypothetical protein HID58_048108 [Brassica napus]|uniref:Uncharacterized protein n=1 Tax=Brassica napus TaxID=3708 RepID=A0ABQ8B2R4_BRANA|nr:hypothetical protein HID58_048108 [Brassica napus]